jgi:hypothetical protein
LTSFLALRTLVRDIANNDELKIHPKFRINETIDRAARKRLWARLPEILDSTPRPLRRPTWLRRTLVIAVFTFLLSTFFFFPLLPEVLVLNILATSIFALVAFLATTALRTDAPQELRIFGDLSRKIAGLTVAINATAETSYNEVFDTAKQIIIETLGVDETEVVPAARFIEDLGAG